MRSGHRAWGSGDHALFRLPSPMVLLFSLQPRGHARVDPAANQKGPSSSRAKIYEHGNTKLQTPVAFHLRILNHSRKSVCCCILPEAGKLNRNRQSLTLNLVARTLTRKALVDPPRADSAERIRSASPQARQERSSCTSVLQPVSPFYRYRGKLEGFQ